MEVRLFHITTPAEWSAAVELGLYRAPSLDTDGFIHLSTEAQWRGVVQRFYRDRDDLVLLVIDSDQLSAEVRHEWADDDAFPHLYGPLDLDAVVEVRAI